MHPVPQKFPVTLTDGVRTYQVHNATDYVNAVFASGHRPAPEPAPAATAPTAPAATVPVPAVAPVSAPSLDAKAK